MSILESIWKSAVLGTVQGLTEFLPVSSSGHLTLLQLILNYDIGASVTLVNILLHVGTLIAVIFVFWKDIIDLFKKPITLLYLVVATVPAGVVGLLFEDKIDALFTESERRLLYLAICFAATALLLMVTEIIAKHRKSSQKFGWKHTVCMGLMQAVALFPGISRSGSTIAAGTMSGAKTEDVSRFSFLMSIPIILGSLAVSMKGIIFDGEAQGMTMGGTAGIVGIIVGMVCAMISGFLAIKFMLKVINKANYKWFSLYLVILSLTCVWLDVINLFPVA